MFLRKTAILCIALVSLSSIRADNDENSTQVTKTTTKKPKTTAKKVISKTNPIQSSFIRTHTCLPIGPYNSTTKWAQTKLEIVDHWKSGFIVKFNIATENLYPTNKFFALRFKIRSCKGGSLKAWNAKMEIDVNRNIVFSGMEKSFAAIAFNSNCGLALNETVDSEQSVEVPQFFVQDLTCRLKGSGMGYKYPENKPAPAEISGRRLAEPENSPTPTSVTTSATIVRTTIPTTTMKPIPKALETTATEEPITTTTPKPTPTPVVGETGCYLPLQKVSYEIANTWFDSASNMYKFASKLHLPSLRDRNTGFIRIIYSTTIAKIQTWNANFSKISANVFKLTPPSYGFSSPSSLSVLGSSGVELKGVTATAYLCERLKDHDLFYQVDKAAADEAAAGEDISEEKLESVKVTNSVDMSSTKLLYQKIFGNGAPKPTVRSVTTAKATPALSVKKPTATAESTSNPTKIPGNELTYNKTWTPDKSVLPSTRCTKNSKRIEGHKLENLKPIIKKIDSKKYKYNLYDSLYKSILFYDAQKAGIIRSDDEDDKRSKYRIPWRQNSFERDGCDVNRDLTRGWFDAGDYVKFNLPQAFSVTLLAFGILEFKDAYIKSGEYENVLNSLEHPLHYLANCVISDKEIVAQVGSGVEDHKFWSSTLSWDHKKRKSYKISKGSDVAGEMAAALAAGSLVYREISPVLSKILLQKAIVAFKFAEMRRGKYSDGFSDVSAFYKSWSGYNDELIWGAAWMYRATGKTEYLDKAKKYYSQFSMSGRASMFDWDNKRAGCQLLMAILTKEPKYWSTVNAFLTYLMKSARKTPKGQVWLSEWGSNRHTGNVASIAMIAAKYTKSSADSGTWSNWGKKQIHLLLGDQGRSYQVGFGKNPPQRPHHRGASCSLKNPNSCSYSNLNKAAPNEIILYGALVGGPDAQGRYIDKRDDYKKNEVAVDYNAGFQTALAGTIYFVEKGMIRGSI